MTAFAATLGPVTWVYIAEIFSNKIRENGMSITTLFLWGACFLTSFLFPIMSKYWGELWTFGLYSLLCFVYFILIVFLFPETKNLSLEELEAKNY